jgi:hypothetical protein
MPELPLDHWQRHPSRASSTALRMTELMRREAAPLPGSRRVAAQLAARGGR